MALNRQALQGNLDDLIAEAKELKSTLRSPRGTAEDLADLETAIDGLYQRIEDISLEFNRANDEYLDDCSAKNLPPCQMRYKRGSKYRCHSSGHACRKVGGIRKCYKDLP